MEPLPPEDGLIAVDLHVHTGYSKDSLTSLPDLIEAVRRRGLAAVAVTDHNRVDGALRLRDEAPFPVIVGEEVKTSRGEVIGLFLERHIPRGMSPRETVAAIREQGGLVYLPHPCDCVRRSVLRPEAVPDIIADVDIVEVINARVTLPGDNGRARALADEHGIAHGAGSDAHTPAEVGAAYALLPHCDLADATAFLEALRRGRVAGSLSLPWVHMSSTFAKAAKRLGLGAGRREASQ